MVRAFLMRSSTRRSLTGWRGLPLLLAFGTILVTVPEARTLIAAGVLGGIVIGAFLILVRHQPNAGGPRRGTPVVLFPRTANASVPGASLRM